MGTGIITVDYYRWMLYGYAVCRKLFECTAHESSMKMLSMATRSFCVMESMFSAPSADGGFRLAGKVGLSSEKVCARLPRCYLVWILVAEGDCRRASNPAVKSCVRPEKADLRLPDIPILRYFCRGQFVAVGSGRNRFPFMQEHVEHVTHPPDSKGQSFRCSEDCSSRRDVFL